MAAQEGPDVFHFILLMILRAAISIVLQINKSRFKAMTEFAQGNPGTHMETRIQSHFCLTPKLPLPRFHSAASL